MRITPARPVLPSTPLRSACNPRSPQASTYALYQHPRRYNAAARRRFYPHRRDDLANSGPRKRLWVAMGVHLPRSMANSRRTGDALRLKSLLEALRAPTATADRPRMAEDVSEAPYE